MNNISAEIIADSKNEHGQRLTTFLVIFPRIVLAEFNTHRMLSRNSASSRAIPFDTMLKRLENEPFIPIKFQKDHPGMQGTEYFEGEEERTALNLWLNAKDNAIMIAKEMSDEGITKQLCNRLLEPFIYHTVIVTASDWENFFKLRAHPAAEIHIQDLAHKMLIEYNNSTPNALIDGGDFGLEEEKEGKSGGWHIPFADKMDKDRIIKTLMDDGVYPNDATKQLEAINDVMIKIAVARCARVSYLNYEGKDDYTADIKLHDRLAKLGHWSPFEHVAVASAGGRSGNFNGFMQYRKTFRGENASDSRVLVK